ncbi:MAG: hypothetical protein ABI693_20010 [Bryobacteraceae bacterium]
MIWPLTPDRTAIEAPRLIRDCLKDFGEPPSAQRGEGEHPDKWMADHPNGMTIRLKDGKWRHILSYRVCHSPAYASSGTAPSKHSGSYIEEVRVGETPIVPWRFSD